MMKNRPSLKSLGITLFGMCAIIAAQRAEAHVCEGTFTVVPSGIQVDQSLGQFTTQPGEVNAAVCPKNLFIELVSVPGRGNALASMSNDIEGSTPQGQITTDLSVFSGDLSSAVGNGLLLAVDFNSGGIKGSLSDGVEAPKCPVFYTEDQLRILSNATVRD